jgi:hypothetical protein
MVLVEENDYPKMYVTQSSPTRLVICYIAFMVYNVYLSNTRPGSTHEPIMAADAPEVL